MLQLYLSLVLTDEARNKVTQIYEKNYGVMMCVSEQVLGKDKNLAPDMVHNAMLKIIDKLDVLELDDDKKTRNLCITIVKNKCLDYLRSKEAKEDFIDDYDLSETKFLVDDIVVSKDNVERIKKAILSLDKRFIGVCLLKFVYEYSNKEIADLLDLNDITVRTRIERAKKKLYVALEEIRNE